MIDAAGFGGRLVAKLISGVRCGRLTVVLPNGERVAASGEQPGPQAFVSLHRWRAMRRLLLGGDVGFADSYIDGDWHSPDLPGLLEFAARNEAALAAATGGTRLPRVVSRLRHLLHVNSRAGSRRNIMAHYDLGNDFYQSWLDAGMSYSSALYQGGDESLAEAQAAKHARIQTLLDARPGQSVLEIGCGWGSMMALLAEAGCAVTGLTLSPAQLAYTQERLRHQANAIAKRLDYRDARGKFDRIVCIEMMEAVGEAYWPVFFTRLRDLLAPGGIAVLQVITIDEQRFADYRRRPDFIQRHIFPGGMLPPPSVIQGECARVGLTVESHETFGMSYARTLAAWRQRFHASLADRRMPDIRFSRLWDYYLAYCEGGFRAGAIDVGLWRLRSPAP